MVWENSVCYHTYIREIVDPIPDEMFGALVSFRQGMKLYLVKFIFMRAYRILRILGIRKEDSL